MLTFVWFCFFVDAAVGQLVSFVGFVFRCDQRRETAQL